MKRFVKLVFIFMICVSLTSCGLFTVSEGKTDNVTVKIGESSKFSQEEIYDAVDCVKEKFKDFEGCELIEIKYDEDKFENNISGNMQEEEGSVNDVSEQNVIILMSSLKTDEHGGDSGFEPNSVYKSWKWILIRDGKNSKWVVDDWGYG